MIEAVEFPHLANKYGVYGVPKTIINEETSLEGAAPEPLLVAKALQAVGMMTEEEVEKLMSDYVAQLDTTEVAEDKEEDENGQRAGHQH